MAHRRMHEIIDDIVKVLFEPDARRITAWVDRIIAKNEECLGKENIHCFIYNGDLYRQSNVRGFIQYRPALDYSLWDEMDRLDKDRRQIELDRSFCKQAMVMLLENCTDLQQIRDALPDCIGEAMPVLAQLERNRPPLYTIAGNPRAQRQVAKIMPKLEMYSVARMLF